MRSRVRPKPLKDTEVYTKWHEMDKKAIVKLVILKEERPKDDKVAGLSQQCPLNNK